MPSALPVSGNTRQTQPENRAFYPALDGFRAIAFLMVFLYHYTLMPWGWAGVNLFFVLSGFLITGILFDTRDDPHRVRNFYVRRTLRIFPLYYGIFLLLVLLWPVMHWAWSWTWLTWAVYLGNFLQLFRLQPASAIQRLANFQLVGSFRGHMAILYFGHFWSLCVEEQFYLVWPWIVFRLRHRVGLLWLCLLSIPVCLAARIAGLHLLPAWLVSQDILAHLTPFRLDDLLAGGALALLLRGPHRDTLFRFARLALLPALLLAVIWAFLIPGPHLQWTGYVYPPGIITWGFTGIQLLTALILLNALDSGTWVYRVLSIRPLRWAGRLSYGAYVFHDIPHGLYAAASRALLSTHTRLFTVVLALPITYLAAWLSFRFFESPFLNLKERWTARS